MKKSIKILVLMFVLAMVIAIVFGFNIMGLVSNNNYDELAKCLTEKGVKMYGTYWCGHCNNQKKMFGESWKYINYVECSLPDAGGQTKVCQDAGISSYPTWEFADGTRIKGELTIEKLKEYANCQN